MFCRTFAAPCDRQRVGITATTADAYPHTVYQAQIDIQINNVIPAARANGFNLIISNQRGQMYTAGGELHFIVHLQAGRHTTSTARCDTRLPRPRHLAARRQRPRAARRPRLRRLPRLHDPRALHRRLPGHHRTGPLPRLSLPSRRRGARPNHLISPRRRAAPPHPLHSPPSTGAGRAPPGAARVFLNVQRHIPQPNHMELR